MGSTKWRLLWNIYLFENYNLWQKIFGFGAQQYARYFAVINYSNNLKLLRDRNGMNFLIEFTSPVSYSQDTKGAINTIYSNNGYTKNLKVQPTSIKLSWIEVGSADNMQIITK